MTDVIRYQAVDDPGYRDDDTIEAALRLGAHLASFYYRFSPEDTQYADVRMDFYDRTIMLGNAFGLSEILDADEDRFPSYYIAAGEEGFMAEIVTRTQQGHEYTFRIVAPLLGDEGFAFDGSDAPQVEQPWPFTDYDDSYGY